MYDYADFVSVLAKRYREGSPKGAIQAIEVWNEPNLSREWGGATAQELLGRDEHVVFSLPRALRGAR